jgi:WhiB family redox-sensing transcriptional regulator
VAREEHGQVIVTVVSRQFASTWHTQALCAGVTNGDAMFFPRSALAAAAAPAKAICARCPVQAACLADALERGDSDGIRGGHTPEERRSLVRHQHDGRLF